MNAARQAIGVGLALLFLAACSGRHPVQKVVTAAVSPDHVVAGFGDCSNRDVTTSPASLNRGVIGLGKQLVPIDAVNVRICEYDSRWLDGNHVVPGQLVESALLKPRAAREFEAETNRQPTENPGPLGCTGPGGGVLFGALTFADDTQRVTLALQIGTCGPPVVSNGYFTAYPTSGWSIDLFRYATKPRAT